LIVGDKIDGIADDWAGVLSALPQKDRAKALKDLAEKVGKKLLAIEEEAAKHLKQRGKRTEP
jgi:hypothetical protein